EAPTASWSHKANEVSALSLHILVAEDNEMNRKIIGHLLDRLGYTYTLTENGQEAVDRVSAEDFDLILMDIRMPVMSGLDATRLIRQMPGRKRNIPILAVSADTLEEQFEECKSAGINDFISKPISRSELEKKLLQYGFNQSGPNA
uniref:response regulator n=1 Tax=Limnobacter sp. TaxID=2003368 RepID=UPI002583A811